MYFHRIPDRLENGEIPEHFVENRTLQVNNNGQQPVEPHRNLTDAYQNYAEATGVTFVFPGDYPEDVNVSLPLVNPETDITLEYLQIYRKAQLAMIASTDSDHYHRLVNLTTEAMAGDRSGNLHIAYNQTLYIGTGELPTDVQLYHGSVTTLQGELRAAGVTVTIEGVVARVENITIVDGGKYLCPSMYICLIEIEKHISVVKIEIPVVCFLFKFLNQKEKHKLFRVFGEIFFSTFAGSFYSRAG